MESKKSRCQQQLTTLLPLITSKNMPLLGSNPKRRLNKLQQLLQLQRKLNEINHNNNF
jgi:hypothetical protein